MAAEKPAMFTREVAQYRSEFRPPHGDAMRGSLLEPGRNCSAIAKAGRASVIVDGADYFSHLETAFNRANRSIVIVGWDFDSRLALRPDVEGSPDLGNFLRSLVEAKPDLSVYILVWNLAALYGPGAVLPLVIGASWHDHPRIQLRLDGNHQLHSAQHQKIVCVDGRIAFVGGIDLTVMRWDTNEHRSDDPSRRLPDGNPYVPVHDLQMLVDGDVAELVYGFVSDRWNFATGTSMPETPGEDDPWPNELKPDFKGVPIAVARTLPAWSGGRECREIEALNIDALRVARKTIYIETQYLAEKRIVDVLAAHLRKANGPEIVIIVTRATHGVLEKWIMGGNRDRMIRKLIRADRSDRFRVYYPASGSRETPCEILVHSKLVIVDDRFLRIGSSNLNRRSMGLDAECDLAIESDGIDTSAAIASLCHRLIAEHLGATPEKVAIEIEREGSVVRAIEKLNVGMRHLADFKIKKFGPTHLMPGTRFLDPRKPIRFLSFFRQWRLRRQRSD